MCGDPLPSTLQEAQEHLRSDGWAIVNNPDPADRLHLRAKPDRSADSLGKYYNGTPVEVVRVKGDWVQVRVDTAEGWMMKKYLDMTPELSVSLSAMPRLQLAQSAADLYARSSLNSNVLRMVDNTWDMLVIGLIEDEWYHVWFPLSGEYGWIRYDALKPVPG